MTQSINTAKECDTNCSGTLVDLKAIKAELIDNQAAVQFADSSKWVNRPFLINCDICATSELLSGARLEKRSIIHLTTRISSKVASS